MSNERYLQKDFSRHYADAAYNQAGRERKAAKVLAILCDSVGELDQLKLLDIGCSTGFMTRCYAHKFRHTLGVDIDENAVKFAATQSQNESLHWAVMNSEQLALGDCCVDIVTCTHIYEHVPDAERLITEIERVLRPGGICFFSAGNRFSLIEPHYKLPLLSVVPKFVAHLYLRILGRGSRYHETHRSYWGLRRLVKKFELTDYTYRVVQNPEKYAADDMLTLGSIKHLFARVFVRVAYFLCPTYLWVLKKRC